MKTIFENDFYRAVHVVPDTVPDGVIVNFTSLHPVDIQTGLSDYPAIEPANFITRSGYIGIFVQTARNDWFQHPSIDDALRMIRQTIAGQGQVISYGTSMGGFGAIAHGNAVGAKLFLAVSPQASLVDSYMQKIGDPRWRKMRSHMRTDEIRAGLCRDRLGVVAFDPGHEHDARHAETILTNTRALALECPGTSHFAAVRLLRDVGFQPIMRRLFSCIGDESALGEFISDTRRVIEDGFAARFMAADMTERERLAAEIGPEELLRLITIQSLVEQFARAPDRAGARLLTSVIPHLRTEQQERYVKRALAAAGLADCVEAGGS